MEMYFSPAIFILAEYVLWRKTPRSWRIISTPLGRWGGWSTEEPAFSMVTQQPRLQLESRP